MAAPRYDGRGFSNPLNPLSLHSENHYRDEPSIGSSFMSDESRVFNSPASAGAKVGAKAGAKVGAKAAAKAASKAAAKASRKALKRSSNAIGAALRTPQAKFFGGIGILTLGGFATATTIIGTGIFETDCEGEAKSLYDPSSQEYEDYLVRCYEDNADSMADTVQSIGKYVVFAGVGLVALIVLTR
jgi:hypothetical protein